MLRILRPRYLGGVSTAVRYPIDESSNGRNEQRYHRTYSYKNEDRLTTRMNKNTTRNSMKAYTFRKRQKRLKS